MNEDDRLWILTIKVPASVKNVGRFMARVLKHLGRAWRVRATAIDVPSEVRQLRAQVAQQTEEIEHLRQLVTSLAERCAGQAEALARAAERRKTG